MSDKFKDRIKNLFLEDSIIIEEIEDDDEHNNFINFIKEKIKFRKKKIPIKKVSDEKIYINCNTAMNIARKQENLEKYVYEEAIDNGYIYGIIDLKDFYATLVRYKNDLFWYLKLIDGVFEFKEDNKNKRGYFDEYSNIRCLVNALSGEFIYIDNKFDTRLIKMIDDSEFLNIIFKIRH